MLVRKETELNSHSSACHSPRISFTYSLGHLQGQRLDLPSSQATSHIFQQLSIRLSCGGECIHVGHVCPCMVSNCWSVMWHWTLSVSYLSDLVLARIVSLFVHHYCCCYMWPSMHKPTIHRKHRNPVLYSNLLPNFCWWQQCLSFFHTTYCIIYI